MEPKYVSLQSVVDKFIRETDAGKHWKNAEAEIVEMAQSGAWDKAAAQAWPNIFGPVETVITEDAEVISIETAITSSFLPSRFFGNTTPYK